MTFLLQLLSTVALVAHVAADVDGIGKTVLISGLENGVPFSDEGAVSTREVVQSVYIRAGERVNGVGIEFTVDGNKNNLYHGGKGGDHYALVLGANEYVTTLEAHVGFKNGLRRIVYMNLTSNHGNSVFGGTPNPISNPNSTDSIQMPPGYQLAGFFGSSGKELDSVGAIWASVGQTI